MILCVQLADGIVEEAFDENAAPAKFRVLQTSDGVHVNFFAQDEEEKQEL